jgi:SAM-dependent methyltransferase
VSAVDPRAASGFGSGAAAYERARPSYAAAAIAHLARALGLGGDSRVLDLAAGTGKLTRALAPVTGHVVAVEPSPAMRAALRAGAPGVSAIGGTAEAIPLPADAVDAVFVGEAFHWFDTERAAREIARVLAPGGGLAMLWNRARWDRGELPWLERFDALVRPLRRDAGEFPGEHWQPALEALGLFAPVERAEFEHVHRLDGEGIVALVGSWSWIANLPDAQRRDVLAEVAAIVDGQGELALPYVTEAYWTSLRRPSRSARRRGSPTRSTSRRSS